MGVGAIGAQASDYAGAVFCGWDCDHLLRSRGQSGNSRAHPAPYTIVCVDCVLQVVNQREGQPNFNAFYMLCNAHTCSDLSHLRLRDASTFKYLANAPASHADGTHGGDASDLSRLESSLNVLGVDPKEVSQVWNVLAAILHIGDLTFSLGERDTVLVEPLVTVRTIAGLLNVNAAELASTLSSLGKDPNRKSMGARHRPEGAAEQGRDALARILYDRLFNFLVQRLNDASCADTSVALMGILDPPGAIKTDEHSHGNFQTLLRNFIHERMLHLFSNHMFTQQQVLGSCRLLLFVFIGAGCCRLEWQLRVSYL